MNLHDILSPSNQKAFCFSKVARDICACTLTFTCRVLLSSLSLCIQIVLWDSSHTKNVIYTSTVGDHSTCSQALPFNAPSAAGLSLLQERVTLSSYSSSSVYELRPYSSSSATAVVTAMESCTEQSQYHQGACGVFHEMFT